MGIAIEEKAWPVVVVRFPARCTGADVDVLLAALDRLLAAGQKFAMVTDVSAMSEPVPAELRARIDEHSERRRLDLGRLSVGNVIVSGSPLMRGVLAAYYRSRDPATEHQVVSSFDEAIDWARERLGEAAPIEAMTELRAGSSPGPDSAVYGTHEAIGAVSLAFVLDLFDDPAFIVNADGSVAGSNEAARKRFGQPPQWLARAVSSEPGPVGPLCRIAIVPGHDGPLQVVVPDTALLPPVELSRPASALPASLRPVADLLAQGMADKEIAAKLDMSLSTVRTYVARAFKKLEVHSRAELIALWAARGG